MTGWLKTGQGNLAVFQRSVFHERLRSDVRDYWTAVYESHPEEALERVAELLAKAIVSKTAVRGLTQNCWELGGKDPRKVKFKGRRTYAYRFIAGVLNATVLSYDDVIRHLCHNRNCVCPDHLVIGTRQENFQDELEKRYSGD